MARILYLSSSIGLGHASKDLAVAGELRRLSPGSEILWLAGHPTSEALRAAGETVLPESERWRGTSAIAERCVRDGALDLVRLVYASQTAWLANARVFGRVLGAYDVDIAVGNEAFEIAMAMVLRILRPKVPFVMILDFIGTEAKSTRIRHRAPAWLLNALWSLDRTIYSGPKHSAVFIGEPDDIPDTSLGWALPNRRRHVADLYHMVGYVIRFDPGDYADRAAWRRRLGYDDRPLVVCAVGGTSVGRPLLQLCADAADDMRTLMPDARVVLVCGPRIPAESVLAPEGVEVLGYVPRLHELFAIADVAVVQCGASSTTELAALGTPFVYFPIEGHFEQELVAARLERHGVGRRLSMASATPAVLAQAVHDAYGKRAVADSMPLGGAREIARHILQAVERAR